MIKTKTFTIGILLAIGLTSCGEDKSKQSENVKTDQEQPAPEKTEKSLSLTKLDSYEMFPDAKLSLEMPEGNKLEKGETSFKFGVENYTLKEQTIGSETLGLANSSKGQHVHFILNNGPYGAKYNEEFTQDLPVGDHVLLAFLSRSYHMAVKTESSYVLKKFRVGKPTEGQKLDVDFEAPHLFYSRPKGTYSGKDAKKIMLDFFLINTDLSGDGNKVKATINGEEFMIDEWAPYAIEGMPMGENTIKLELFDNEGNYIEGPFNKVERTITLEQ